MSEVKRKELGQRGRLNSSAPVFFFFLFLHDFASPGTTKMLFISHVNA